MNNDSGKHIDETISAGTDTLANPEKKRRLGKKTRIFLVILLVLALAIGFLCIRYWHIVSMVANKENINAYLNSRKYTAEELEGQMEENKVKMEQIAEESPLIQIRGELTEEEIEALKNGEITPEEAKSLVKGDITLEEIREKKAAAETKQEPETSEEEPSDKEKEKKEEKKEKETTTSKDSSKTPSDKKDTSSDKTSGDKSSKPSSETKPAEPVDKASEIVSELYVIQADFMNRLEAVGNQAYADYKATSYDRSQVMTIVDSYTATVGAMEAECDGRVNGLLKELDAELKKTGEDRSIVKEIRNYYYTEKSLKKSYYLDMLDNEDYK